VSFVVITSVGYTGRLVPVNTVGVRVWPRWWWCGWAYSVQCTVYRRASDRATAVWQRHKATVISLHWPAEHSNSGKKVSIRFGNLINFPLVHWYSNSKLGVIFIVRHSETFIKVAFMFYSHSYIFPQTTVYFSFAISMLHVRLSYVIKVLLTYLVCIA